jgi:heptaprenylglyceryl phosphate synthase
MKLRFLIIFLLIVAAIISYALYPVIQEANKPINKFIREAKSQGGAPLVQFITNGSQASKAARQISIFNQTSGTKIVGKSFMANKANMEFVRKFQSNVPGYVIFNADDNVAYRGKGVVDTSTLKRVVPSIHLH